MNFDWFIIGFLVLAVSERIFARRFSQRAIRGQVKMSWTLVALDVVHTLVYLGTAAECFIFHRSVSWPVVVVGMGIYASSVLLRHVAIRTLGKFWSLHVEIREGHQLIREGIYKHLRHPAYSAIMLEVVAIPLIGNAYLTLLVSVCVYIPVLLIRWAGEEQELARKFGEQYKQYQREVPAFIPWKGSVARRADVQ